MDLTGEAFEQDCTVDGYSYVLVDCSDISTSDFWSKVQARREAEGKLSLLVDVAK